MVTCFGKRREAASISSASARSFAMRAWQKTCLPASSAETGILPVYDSTRAIGGQDAHRPHRQDACATSEESLDHCGPRKHFTLPFFHNPGDWINCPYPLPHV